MSLGKSDIFQESSSSSSSSVEQTPEMINIINTIRKNYPQRLIQAFGGEMNIHNLPTLDLGDRGYDRDYIDFVRPSDMVGSKVKKGIQDGRPFISICAKDTSDNTLAVQTLFQRYTKKPSPWVVGGKDILGFSATLKERQYTDLEALLSGESCTPYAENRPYGIFKLTDQSEFTSEISNPVLSSSSSSSSQPLPDASPSFTPSFARVTRSQTKEDREAKAREKSGPITRSKRKIGEEEHNVETAKKTKKGPKGK